jgi:hypothetical protein
MLQFQQELSSAIAEQMRLTLSPERVSALARRPPRNPEAFDMYLLLAPLILADYQVSDRNGTHRGAPCSLTS